LNLEVNKKYFVFTVALFPGLEEKKFDSVYEMVTEALQRRHVGLTTGDLNALRSCTSSYITGTGRIGFRHPNYWEGVMEGILEECGRDLVDVIPALKELAKDRDSRARRAVAYALGMIGKIKPDETFPALKELAKDNDSDVRRTAEASLREILALISRKQN